MPNWHQLLQEVKSSGSTHDILRRKYLRRLHRLTGRNVIAYYSGWLEKGRDPGIGADFGITDGDKNGFMTTIHQMDRDKGLDLILHTPGGSAAATESLVHYLRAMFGTDMRAIVPQIALSAGTMVSLACQRVLMGEHSSLGPIDPQIGGVPAHGIIEEFKRAAAEIQADRSMVAVWQPIIAKYTPTLIGEAEKAVKWAVQMVREWLLSGMFHGEPDAAAKADRVLAELSDHSLTLSHERHISIGKAQEIGVRVDALEADDDLQDAVLSVHHAMIQTLSATSAYKVIENHRGVASIRMKKQS